MPDKTRKQETARLLAQVDQLLAQSQSLRRDISRKMQQARADTRPVPQPLGTPRAAKRRRKGA